MTTTKPNHKREILASRTVFFFCCCCYYCYYCYCLLLVVVVAVVTNRPRHQSSYTSIITLSYQFPLFLLLLMKSEGGRENRYSRTRREKTQSILSCHHVRKHQACTQSPCHRGCQTRGRRRHHHERQGRGMRLRPEEQRATRLARHHRPEGG